MNKILSIFLIIYKLILFIKYKIIIEKIKFTIVTDHFHKNNANEF